MPSIPRRLANLALVLLAAGPARAADCTPATRTSTCFDADTLWTPAAPSRFHGIPSSSALSRGRYSLGVDVSYLSRPVTLKALSPDPSGRTVAVVDDVVDAALAAAYSPVAHLEVGFVLPAALYRTGTGLSGVTSRVGPALTTAALRDVRIGAGYDLVAPRTTGDSPRFTAMSRLELALPTGDEGSFAGDRGPVLAPSVVFGLELGRGRLAAEEGARLRSPSDFGDARLGSQFVSSLGGSVEIVPRLVGASLEAWILPNFLSTGRQLPDGTVVTSGALVPAEWLGSVWTHVSEVLVSMGGGTAIPLSNETRVGPDGVESTDHFAGVTTPRFRLVFTLRYAPGTAL